MARRRRRTAVDNGLRRCERCSEEYGAVSPLARFCGDRCRNAAWREKASRRVHKCPLCREPHRPRKPPPRAGKECALMQSDKRAVREWRRDHRQDCKECGKA